MVLVLGDVPADAPEVRGLACLVVGDDDPPGLGFGEPVEPRPPHQVGRRVAPKE